MKNLLQDKAMKIAISLLIISNFIFIASFTSFAGAASGGASGGGGGSSSSSSGGSRVISARGSGGGGDGIGYDDDEEDDDTYYDYPYARGYASGGGIGNDEDEEDDDEEEETTVGVNLPLLNSSNSNNPSLGVTSAQAMLGTLVTTTNSLWMKNVDGSYSLVVANPTTKAVDFAKGGFYTIVSFEDNKIETATYYFGDDGKMKTEAFTDANGILYTFGEDGKLIKQ